MLEPYKSPEQIINGYQIVVHPVGPGFTPLFLHATGYEELVRTYIKKEDLPTDWNETMEGIINTINAQTEINHG